MKPAKPKIWIFFALTLTAVGASTFLWRSNVRLAKMNTALNLNSFVSSRSPASVKRLSEQKFTEHEEQTLMLWIRFDYQRLKGKKQFFIESHVVASPKLKLTRLNVQTSTTTGRFLNVPIVDENGTLLENLEFENQNFTLEPNWGKPGQSNPTPGKGKPEVAFEDGRKHSYLLRLPITEHFALFNDVLKLGERNSEIAETLLAQKIKKLESIYIIPAIDAVMKMESMSEASDQEAATVRTNVLGFLAKHFENVKTLTRLRQETAAAKAKLERKDSAQNSLPKGKIVNRAVASTEAPASIVRTLAILDSNGNAITSRKTNRINLVFLGDGFQESEMEIFFQAAQNKLDYLMQESAPRKPNPIFPYRGLFNAIAVFTPSHDSGACHPENKTPCPDTVFKMSFNISNIPRLLGLGDGSYDNYSSITRTYAPDYDFSIIISNDPVYGGGGGIPATVSLSEAASDVVTHELIGHSFAHLGDEYTYAYPGYPDKEEPNTTINGDPNSVKWAQWEKIDPASLMFDPNTIINAPVQGAHYHETGWYRPAKTCKMEAYGQPFCPVCVEAVIRAVYTKTKPIDATTPPAGDVDTSGGNWSLNVLTTPATSILEIQWSINGQAIDLSGSPTFTPDALTSALAQYPDIAAKGAPYFITAKVIDQTNLVSSAGRQDHLLEETVSWKLK